MLRIFCSIQSSPTAQLTRAARLGTMVFMRVVGKQVEQRLSQLDVPIQVLLPGGLSLGDATRARLRLHIKHWRDALHLLRGNIGVLAQAYVQGEFELEGTMRDLMHTAAQLLPHAPNQHHSAGWLQGLQRLRSKLHHSLRRDAAQVQFHYDVSDEFYALWLDPLRVYSCAYYSDPAFSLAQAQQAKLDLICRKLQLRPGMRFLDIGAGWGALLIWAAQHYGVQALGVTLSRNQHAYMQDLIARHGLQRQVQAQLLDYRLLDEQQAFDRIASIGMLEHVGQAHMSDYFGKICRLLKPGALMLAHGITATSLDNRQLGAGMGDFIERYIFPGGELLHPSAMAAHISRGGLELLDAENLRPHYARTLWDWSDGLESQLLPAQQALQLKLAPAQAERALRAYRLYLAGCAMSFEWGWIAIHQFLGARLSGQLEQGTLRGAQSDYAFNRAYMYR